MQLTAAQVAEMQERGFLLLPSLFSPDEVDVLLDAIPQAVARGGPELIAEDDDPSTIKMLFGLHRGDDAFHRLCRHPRVIAPAEQILGDRAHLFQSRLNMKSPFRASGWPWHQDFNQWHRYDGLRTPLAVVAGVFLDDVNPCNGPLLVIPGSHKIGHVMNDESMDMPEDVVEAAARRLGIVPLMGPPGTVVFFDCLLVHASSANVTPWPRRIFYLNFSAVSNRELLPQRQWFHCDTDPKPIAMLADDCLLERRATA